LPKTDKKIGIDLGLCNWMADSDGKTMPRKDYTRKFALKLKFQQRKLKLNRKKGKKGALLQKGSRKFSKIKLKIGKIHAKIGDLRRNNIHQETSKIINENQVIVLESLKVKNMIRNKKLSKAIADASWGEVVRQLSYKANRKGRTLIQIDEWFPSSKKCCNCGNINKNLRLRDRIWQCPHCQMEHERDINAAKNILAHGLWVLASKETGSGAAA